MRAELARYLEDLARYRMPFGKFKEAPLYDLPLEYLLWFRDRAGGFPQGRLGELMSFVCETKAAGAEEIFRPLRKAAGGRHELFPRHKMKEWRASEGKGE